MVAGFACTALVGGVASVGTATVARAAGTTKITVALDYIANNAGYDGFYVAVKKGYFAKQGLDVTFLPYANTSADVIVEAGKADFGTIDEPSLEIDDAAGQQLTSIMDIMQHDSSRLAVRPDLTAVTSPKDLSGKTFGGFGGPMEAVYNDVSIENAGGKPSYKTVTLGTDVYTALTQGQVDWAIPYATDDILWAQMRGHPFKVFNPQNYGVPDNYNKLIFSSAKYLKANPAIAKAFVAASQEGYTWAQKNPVQATVILNDSKVGTMNMPDQEGTAKDLAKNYWLDAKGVVGPETAAMWQKMADFMTKQKVLKDSSGKVLTTAPNTSSWWTNSYLPSGGA
jgi:ABC-type nitrate/sulfonate/bicarbonate transport system substrate-binding protein